MKMRRRLILLICVLLTAFTTLSSQNTFQMPSEDWTLEIDLDGFKIEREAYSTDSTMFRLSATNSKTNINVSIFIEKADAKGDKEDCRYHYWNKAKNSPLAKENVTTYETELLAIVEHDTKEFNGQVVNFHSLNAYLTKDGYWMDIHLSKVEFSKNDKKVFETLVESITIK